MRDRERVRGNIPGARESAPHVASSRLSELAEAIAFAHLGAGTDLVYVDPDPDLMIVARWTDRDALDGLAPRVLAVTEDWPGPSPACEPHGVRVATRRAYAASAPFLRTR